MLWGVVLVGITELLSVFHSLTVSGLAVAWLVALLIGVVFVIRTGGHRQLSVRSSVPSLARLDVALLGPLATLVLVLAVVAVLSPPNTWDSMTYHMARLIHWSQDASLAPYPTHIPRQLYMQPGAEFVLLHVQILSGGDRLAGLVQWASMVGVLVGTSLTAHHLGARRPGALCATIFAASLPIGILEATSTQNDYVVAFWDVCVMAFGLRLVRSAGRALPWATAAAFGASIGLAVLTKATAYLVVLPIVLWVTLSLTRRAGWRSSGLLVVAGAIALALNCGFFARNLVVFGSPIGPLDEGAPSLRYVNEGFTPPLLVSNVVRNIGVNLNATPLVALNVRTVRFVRLVHAWLGVEIADPRTTWGQEIFAEQPVGLAYDENFASNPVHLFLILFALAAVWPMRRRLSRTSVVYALVLIGGFGLLSAVLRWQPWNTRLELPLFVLGAPLLGTIVERITPRLAVVLAVVLLLSMPPWVVYNQARQLVGPRSMFGFSRDERYFTNRPSMRSAYLGAVGYLVERGCAQIGFTSTVDGWEYPLWPLLEGTVPGGVEIEHVGVSNVSASRAGAAASQFEPCAVVALGPTANVPSIDFHGQTFKPSWARLDPTAVLEQVAVLTVDGR